MTQEEFYTLIDRHLEGRTTDEEKQQLINFTASFQQEGWNEQLLGDPAPVRERLYAKVRQAQGRIHFLRKWGWVAAACIIGVAVYLGLQRENEARQETVVSIPPGGTKAQLTLGDGTVVELDSTSNQVISTAVRQDGGLLSYDAKTDGAAVSQNTLSTPKGGQFRLQLPDGTMVWLNSASRISYPTAFTGKERKVDISGEAYFEVAEQAGKPFRVTINGKTEVLVLGTRFNIQAYDNETMLQTTLLQGSIRISTNKESLVLKPGQQARLTADKLHLIPDADADKAVAWKNGYFNFDNASLGEVMRQLERWYDIEVVYEKNIPDVYFVGEISRSTSLENVLAILEQARVHFRISGRRLTVLP